MTRSGSPSRSLVVGLIGVLTPFGVVALPGDTAVLACTVSLTALCGYAFVGFVRQARAGGARRLRWGWRIAAASSATWGLTNLLSTLSVFVPPATGADLIMVGQLASLLSTGIPPLALLLIMPGAGSVVIRMRRFIDVATVSGALALLAWYLVLQNAQDRLATADFATLLPLPLLQLLTAAIGIMLLSRSLSQGLNALNLMALSAPLFATATLTYMDSMKVGQFGAQGAAGVVYLWATAATAIASRLPAAASVSLETEHTSGRWTVLPVLPVLFAFVTAGVQQARSGTLGPVLPWMLLAMATMVLSRQLLSGQTQSRLLSDVTRQRAELAWQAHHDPLTGLANRARLTADADAARAAAAAETTMTAVVLFDLDGFKPVNDTWGHAAGDELLSLVAERLRVHARARDTVARLGGDEFVLLLTGLPDEETAEDIAERALIELAQPASIAGRPIPVRASAGVACETGRVADLDSLLRQADIAMYEAKGAGKCRVRRFRPNAEHDSPDRQPDIIGVVDRNELELVYQPIVRLSGAEVVGIEALLRWRHPVSGLLRPDAFLPEAERLGLMPEIGSWALRTACREAAAWQDLQPGLEVNVNVSASQLADPAFVSRVREALHATGLPAGSLILEVTEALAPGDTAAAAAVLGELRELGVRVALDDFGTGHSSLTHIAALPIDMIKVNELFVGDLDGIGGVVTHAVLTMARDLRLIAVAEGVVDEPQAEELRRLGCDRAQGFHFAEPVPAEEIHALLRHPRPRVPAVASISAA